MIKKVAINNFRGFDEFGCDCFAPITVIGGRNNSGKSSLLEALALTLDIKGCDMLLSTNRIRGVDMSKLDDLRSLFNQGDTTRGVLIASEFDDLISRKFRMEFNSPEVVLSSAASASPIPIDSVEEMAKYSPHILVHVSERPLKALEDSYSKKFFVVEQNENGLVATQISDAPSGRGLYVSPNLRDYAMDRLINLYKKGEAESIDEALRSIDDRIESVLPIDNSLYVKLRGVKPPIALKSLGDGAVKVAMSLAMVLFVPDGGVCAFDEVENGLHYSAMRLLWGALVKVARRRNVQLIASTHSLEMLHAMKDVSEENQGSDFVYLKMACKKGGKIVFSEYEYSAFKTHLQEDFELR